MPIEEDKLPVVLPASVARTGNDGLPTQAQVDWEQRTRDWYKKSAVDLSTRLDEVFDTFGDVTAKGQIYFEAKAAPEGATAAYGLYLTAGKAFTGFEAIAKSDGSSAILFTADQFSLNTSSGAKNVFNYNSTENIFRFNVPVEVQTANIASRAINAPAANSIDGQLDIVDTTDWTTLVSTSAVGEAGGVAVVFVDFEYMRTQLVGGNILLGEWRIIRTDQTTPLKSGILNNVADFFSLAIALLDDDFQNTYTYELQAKSTVVHVGSGSGSFSFRNRSILIDLRKR